MLPSFLFVLLLHGMMIFAQQERLNFTITKVVQCEPVSIKFPGDTEEVISPMVPTIFPFKSTPVVYTIPSITLNSTVIKLTPFPLPAGENLIASLNDEAGQQLSEVITVTPSPTSDRTCLENPSPGLSLSGGYFNLISTPSQYGDLSVAYVTDVAPTVRALMPNGGSFALPQTSDDRNGTAKYLVNIQFGSQLLFLFDDGLDHRETTNLMTVLGDSMSRKDCLPGAPTTSHAAQPFELPSSDLEPTPIPQSLIIGFSVGGAVAVITVILMVIFILRDRRRRRHRTVDNFGSQCSFGNAGAPSDSDSLGTDTFEKITSIKRAIDDDSKERSGIRRERSGIALPYVRGTWNDDRPTPISPWLYDDGWGIRGASVHRRSSVDSEVTDVRASQKTSHDFSSTSITGIAFDDNFWNI